MEKKYELTEETLEHNGHTLHRIKALIAFGNVKVGELGGWVENEDNLSQHGLCWIYYNAKVFDKACVSDNAKVYGFAKVYDNARVSNNAEVYGCADVYDNALVCGNAVVCGDANVRDNAKVYGSAMVSGHVWVSDYAEVYDFAKVCDYSEIKGNQKVSGRENIGGDNSTPTNNSNMNNQYKVSINITMSKDIYVDAENAEQAREKAIENVKENSYYFADSAGSFVNSVVTDIVNEDENIRKWLIAQLNIKSDVNNSRELELMILKSIAYLEKLGGKSVK